jgi:CAAX protease family protein
MKIFTARPQDRLRLVWRLLLHGAAVSILGLGPVFVVAEGLTTLHRRGLFLAGLPHAPYDMVINMIVGPLLTAGIVTATLLCSSHLDRRQARDLGAIPDRFWLRDWSFGLLLGGVLMGGIFLLERVSGWVRIVPQPRLESAHTSLALCIGFSLTKALCVGVYEEFVSRGYHLHNLAEAFRRDDDSDPRRAGLWAALSSSALFALLHASTAHTSALSMAGLLCVGLLLAAGVLFTGRLGLAIGLHTGWNFFQGAVFGFPVSGDLEPGSLMQLDLGGPVWITGGSYGPEGGCLGALAAVTGIVAVACWARVCHSTAALHVENAGPLRARERTARTSPGV